MQHALVSEGEKEPFNMIYIAITNFSEILAIRRLFIQTEGY